MSRRAAHRLAAVLAAAALAATLLPPVGAIHTDSHIEYQRTWEVDDLLVDSDEFTVSDHPDWSYLCYHRELERGDDTGLVGAWEATLRDPTGEPVFQDQIAWTYADSHDLLISTTTADVGSWTIDVAGTDVGSAANVTVTVAWVPQPDNCHE